MNRLRKLQRWVRDDATIRVGSFELGWGWLAIGHRMWCPWPSLFDREVDLFDDDVDLPPEPPVRVVTFDRPLAAPRAEQLRKLLGDGIDVRATIEGDDR